MKQGEHTHVWRGVVKAKDIAPIRVIAKFNPAHSFSESVVIRLREESDIYSTTLVDAQGAIVPKFFGYYTGIGVEYPSKRKRPVAFLVLEDCGMSIRHDFAALPMEDRYALCSPGSAQCHALSARLS